MKKIQSVFRMIDTITSRLAMLALIGTFALVFLNVIMRYVFGSGFAWSEEGARYALMAVIIFGALEVTHGREHFYVDLLTNVVPSKVKKVFQIIQDVLMLFAMAVLTYGSWDMTILNWNNRTPAIGMPSWIPYGIMLFSSAISLLYLLEHLMEDCGLHLGLGENEKGEDSSC